MRSLLCKLFGHKYGYVARLSPQSHMLACKRCRKRFAINTDVRVLLDWDLELEDFYTAALPERTLGTK